MKVTDLLKAQHKEVKKLFAKIEDEKRLDVKSELFEELAHDLVAHDAIEREIFYPACEQKMGMTDLLGEVLVEHGVVEFSLYLVDQARKTDDFDYKLTVLEEVVEHHVKEEEHEFFPKVEKALGAEALERLGARMEAQFEKVKAKDFRPPLHKNLKEVLAGATKPPTNGASRPARKRSANAAAKRPARSTGRARA